MNIRKTTGSSVALLAVLLSASLAPAAVLSDSAVTCRAAAAKGYGKIMKTALKVMTGCHKARDKGDLTLTGVNCNDINAADTKDKFSKAKTKYIDTVTDACAAAVNSELTSASILGKEWYISCPVTPCLRNDNTPISNPITTMADAAACQACDAGAIAGAIGVETLGLPAQGLGDVEQKCRGAIEKGYSKFLNTAIKNDLSCQTTADAADTNDYAACEDAPDLKSKVSGALTKASEGLASACATANLTAIDSCATDIPGLQTCNSTEWNDSEDDAFVSVYELPANICPNAIRTTILGGCSVADTGGGTCAVIGNASGTSLSVGWKGLAHNVDIVDKYTLAGDVSCPGTLGACGVCTVDGISYDNPQYADFTRCRSDSHIPCANPFGTDTSCTTNGDSQATTDECSYFLGPPLAVSAGGTPTCSMNTLSTNISGTVDPDAGTSLLLVNLNTDVHTGDSLTRPCPICRFDTVAQDGVRSGTCLGGLNDGGTCDVQGFDLTFARLDLDPENPTEGNSLDCPPDPGKAIGSLKINLPLSTGTVSKTAEDPCESPNQSEDCFCGVCGAGIGTDSCDNDQFCDLLDDTIDNDSDNCAAAAPGAPRLQNNCSDGICVPSGGATDKGLCSNLPDYEKYCDGALTASGAGIIKCANDASCDVQNTGDPEEPDTWVCDGNDCGNCSIQVTRSCFLNPIELTGTPDTERPILVGTFCLPPSGNGSVNDTTGSPGPAVVQTDSVVEKRY